MQRALVIGASGGIGAALAAELARRGAEVSALSRRADGLDITDEDSIARALGRLEPPFARILIATGALAPPGGTPEKALRELDPGALARLFAVNATGPALVLKHAVRLLPRREPALIAALSARVGSIGDNRLGGWYAYRASKAALNQLVRSAAVELARSHRQLACVALHPGTVATAFTEAYADRHPRVPAEQAAARLLDVADRLGPAESGGFFDYAGREIAW
ncbi:SDR family NAD(P)-dependent oxidoreductase [Roseivivax sp. CAU 1761]